MKHTITDQDIVQALGFANLVLLDQSFQQINFLSSGSKQTSIRKIKQPAKSKFEKVPRKKQKTMPSTNKFEKITLDSYHKPTSKQEFIHSKVKICEDEFDIFSKSTFNNNNLSYFTPAKTDQYTLNDFLNQTSVASSRSRFSPINAWKTSSVEKYDPHHFLNSDHEHQNISYYKNANNQSTPLKQKKQNVSGQKQKSISTTKSVSKKGRKFQKYQSSRKMIDKQQKTKQEKITTIKKQPTIIQQFKIEIPASNQLINKNVQSSKDKFHLKQTQLYQHSVSANQDKSFYDNETRDTCELAPSKLEKLIQVEDNKYKEMVLKTFYKNQK